jgi:hypothetical protein
MYFSSPKFEEGEDTEAKVICNRTLFFSPAVGFHYRIRNGTTSMQDFSERFTTYLIFGFIMNEHIQVVVHCSYRNNKKKLFR